MMHKKYNETKWHNISCRPNWIIFLFLVRLIFNKLVQTNDAFLLDRQNKYFYVYMKTNNIYEQQYPMMGSMSKAYSCVTNVNLLQYNVINIKANTNTMYSNSGPYT